jgi:hypothetical protein
MPIRLFDSLSRELRELKPSQADGVYRWQVTSHEHIDNKAEVPELVARRRRFDTDLWVLELDVPSRERFAAEMNEPG